MPTACRWRASRTSSATAAWSPTCSSSRCRSSARSRPSLRRAARHARGAGPEALGRALVAAGGASRAARARLLARPARAAARARPGFELTPVDRPRERPAAGLPGRASAGPRRRADDRRRGQPTRTSTGMLARRARAGARLQRRSPIADGRVVGAILVARVTDAPPPFGGPWVMELFRAPGRRGAGRALLERALRAAPRADARAGGHRGQSRPSGSTRRSASSASSRRTQSISSARATIAAPSTPAGSVP